MTRKPPRPSGSSESVGFVDPAAGAHRLEVGDVLALLPDPPAFLDELVDAVGSQPVGLRRHPRRRGQLVDRDLAGDVLVAEVVERRAHLAGGRGTYATTRSESRDAIDAVVSA